MPDFLKLYCDGSGGGGGGGGEKGGGGIIYSLGTTGGHTLCRFKYWIALINYNQQN